MMSGENTLEFKKNTARAYYEIGLLSNAEKLAAESSNDINMISEIIKKVPKLSTEQRAEFADKFIGDDLTEFNGADLDILKDAYSYLGTKLGRHAELGTRMQKVAARIDDLSEELAKNVEHNIRDENVASQVQPAQESVDWSKYNPVKYNQTPKGQNSPQGRAPSMTIGELLGKRDFDSRIEKSVEKHDDIKALVKRVKTRIGDFNNYDAEIRR